MVILESAHFSDAEDVDLSLSTVVMLADPLLKRCLHFDLNYSLTKRRKT